MANKSRKAAKRGNIYETVDGVMYSQYETSLKKAKTLRNEWIGA